MNERKLLNWVIAAAFSLSTGGTVVRAQEQQDSGRIAAADILQMLQEDLAANGDEIKGDDAEHIRRLQRLHELKSETVIAEAAGAQASASDSISETSDTEQMVWDHDLELQQMWKEIAELRRSIKGVPATEQRPESGIEEPIPYDPQLDAAPNERGPIERSE